MVLEKTLSRVSTAPTFTIKLNPKEYKSSVGCSFGTSTNKTKKELEKGKSQKIDNKITLMRSVMLKRRTGALDGELGFSVFSH